MSICRDLTDEEQEKISLHALWLESKGKEGEKADFSGKNLRKLDLSYTNLNYAEFCGADLSDTYLSGSDLRGANLRGANLNLSDLRNANFSGADLRNANFSSATLYGAIFTDTNLDYSSWPLWCGSIGVKADDRLVSQLIYHVTRLDVSGCSEDVKEEIEKLQKSKLANLFCKFRDDLEEI